MNVPQVSRDATIGSVTDSAQVNTSQKDKWRVGNSKRTRARYGILALLATGTLINYLDRTVLGVAAPSLKSELHLAPVVMGLLFSAFAWTYTASQLPGGILLDKIGTKLTYFLSVSLWSVFTMLQGFATGLASLLTFRLGLGVAESPCFPANSRVVATWFPRRERAMATGVYTVGEYVGLAFLSPVLFWMVGAFGWRSLFYVVATLGFLFAIGWWLGYREPGDSKRVNQAELDYIASDDAPLAATSRKFEWSLVGKLIWRRQLLGI